MKKHRIVLIGAGVVGYLWWRGRQLAPAYAYNAGTVAAAPAAIGAGATNPPAPVTTGSETTYAAAGSAIVKPVHLGYIKTMDDMAAFWKARYGAEPFAQESAGGA